MSNRFPCFLISTTVWLFVFLVSVPSARAQTTTALFLDSQPGDYIGQGLRRTLTSSDLAFTASTRGTEPVQITVSAGGSDYFTTWYMNFVTLHGTPGVYENAVRESSIYFVSPQLNVYGSGRGCNTVAGRFQIYEFSVSPSGTVNSFAADFEQHCEGVTPALFGAIRYNSTRSSLVPFGGAYPVYSLQLDAAVNGYVTGPGIDCGAGRTDCDEIYTPNALVALHATPAAGYIFLGWVGDCRGDQDATVPITRRRFCTPVFNVAPGAGGTESPNYSDAALFLDTPGTPEVPPGRRIKQAFVSHPAGSPILSAVISTAVSSNQLQFVVVGPGGAGWTLSFGAPPGAVLATGNFSYTATNVFTGGQVPILSVSGSSPGTASLSCNSGGRFTVHELTTQFGFVTAFAVDFELPCGSSGGLLAGSLRYTSTRSTLLPFDGVYPRYALRVVPSLGGYVTSAGIDCGDGGRTDCDEIYGSPQTVSLQAAASSGYEFVGWSGSCSDGNAITALTIDRDERCFAVFTPTSPGGPPADPGLAVATLVLDGVSPFPPTRKIWLSPEAAVSVSQSGRSSVNFGFTSAAGSSSLSFRVPGGSLAAGDYDEAYPNGNGLFPSFYSSTCFSSLARFRIYQATFNAGGTLQAFAADFEAICDFYGGLHVVGAVRYNATRADILAFDGVYPLFKLTIDPPLNGVITAAGIDCGPGHSDCSEIYSTGGAVTLQATPLAGFKFVGWSGGCNGPSTTTITVDWPRRCSAIFNAVIPGSGVEDPRIRDSAFLVDSPPGDTLGNGLRHVWLDAVISASGRELLNATIYRPDGRSWSIYLRAPSGQVLTARSYENAGNALFGASSSPGLFVFSPSGSCGTPQGRFVIHEISFDPTFSNIVASLAADFEMRCSASGPLVRGSIRYHSTRSVLIPFGPTIFTPVPTPPRSDFNRDGWPDLIWRHAASGHNAIWLMNGPAATAGMFLQPSFASQVPDLNWEIRAIGDMNGDGSPDLIWQNRATGQIAVWFFSGGTCIGTNYLRTAAQSTFETDLDWKIVAAGDMDRDGQTDLLWRHRTTGALRLWHMNGLVQWDSVPLWTVSDPRWEVAGLADLNGDGLLDLVWRHYGDGSLAAWFMSDAVVQTPMWLSPRAVTDTDWRIVGLADMNSDGKADLVWQKISTGHLAVWFMDGVNLMSGMYLNPSVASDPNWRIVGVR